MTTLSKFFDLSVRVQALLAVAALLGCQYLMYAYLVAPRRAQAAEVKARVDHLLQEVHRGQIVEARLPQFRQDIFRQREHLDNLRNILPEEKETADIVRRVQQLAVESNLRIRSFTPQPTVQRDFYEDWPILISVEGNYRNLGAFFQKVSEFTRIVNVENLTIKGSVAGAGRGTLSATCTAVTFVFKDNKDNKAQS